MPSCLYCSNVASHGSSFAMTATCVFCAERDVTLCQQHKNANDKKTIQQTKYTLVRKKSLALVWDNGLWFSQLFRHPQVHDKVLEATQMPKEEHVRTPQTNKTTTNKKATKDTLAKIYADVISSSNNQRRGGLPPFWFMYICELILRLPFALRRKPIQPQRQRHPIS